jgi:hypothetical protein
LASATTPGKRLQIQRISGSGVMEVILVMA